MAALPGLQAGALAHRQMTFALGASSVRTDGLKQTWVLVATGATNVTGTNRISVYIISKSSGSPQPEGPGGGL